jgi:hypothetical protein
MFVTSSPNHLDPPAILISSMSPQTSAANSSLTATEPPSAPSSQTSMGVDSQPTVSPSSSSNRQLFNQRLQKYHLSANFEYKCDGPQHAQKWKCYCHVGKYFVGCSNWHNKMEAAKEEASGYGLRWFNKFGYP